MTMEHIARSFAVSLQVRHPSIDPAEITAALSLFPKRACQSGTLRRTPVGAHLEGTYPHTYWTHEFEAGGAEDLGDVLSTLMQRLWPHRLFFHRIVREGGSVELFCGVFADGNWDESLSHVLLGSLANLQINLRLDVYTERERKPA